MENYCDCVPVLHAPELGGQYAHAARDSKAGNLVWKSLSFTNSFIYILI
jgi:hypothetical protein